MKFFLCLFFIVLLVVGGIEAHRLLSQRDDFEHEIEKLQTQASILESQNARLVGDIEYFSRVENLAKEFKSKFNYRAPDEKLIIIVPGKEEPGR